LIRAFVDNDHRGKDYTLLILNFVTEKLKEKIMITSDEETSSDSRKMLLKWSKLGTERRFKMKQFIGDDEVNQSWDEILAPHVKNDVSIMLEALSDKKYRLFGAGPRVISDWIW
jgi:hypothetical protein